MPAQILNGRALAQKICAKITAEIQQRVNSGFRKPGLAVILIGDDSASHIYVTHKQKAAESAGLFSKTYHLPITTTQQELLEKIDILNLDQNIDGILVQLPLPAHINTAVILGAILPSKDVDGFHPINIGKLAQGNPMLRSCTPYGIMLLLQETKLILQGLHAVVIGTSNIVGKPMAFELLKANATVTMCHKYTSNLPELVKQADIVIAATGNAHLVKGSWLKPGTIVIDVGMNRLANGLLVGDVEFDEAKNIASWITPVPGGVGPMTIAVLLQNTLAANKQIIQQN